MGREEMSTRTFPSAGGWMVGPVIGLAATTGAGAGV